MARILACLALVCMLANQTLLARDPERPNRPSALDPLRRLNPEDRLRQEGDLVLRDPLAMAGELQPPSSRANSPAPSTVLVRTVRPETNDARRATRTEPYGLTEIDLRRIQALPEVVEAIPARIFPLEVRYLAGRVPATLIATNTRYRDVTGIHLAAGRFLTPQDDAQQQNVAVLGATVAAKLFPGRDPLKKVVVMGRSHYQVVGVLRKQATSNTVNQDRGNTAVFITLRTCQARFGEKLVMRAGNAWRVENVALHEIRVIVRTREKVKPTVRAIKALLQRSHRDKDWE